MSVILKGDPTAGIRPGSPSYFSTLIPPHAPPISDEPFPSAAPDAPKQARRVLGFDPDHETADKIFKAFYSHNSTFGDIAYDNGCSIEALSLWMARPDIAERMANLNSASAARLRLVGIHRLHHALEALSVILREFNDSACYEAAIQEGRGASASSHYRRDRETACRAAALVMRLANFDPNRPRLTRIQNSRTNEAAGETQTTPPHSSHAPTPVIPQLPTAPDFAALNFLLNHLSNFSDPQTPLPNAATSDAAPLPTTSPQPANSTPPIPAPHNPAHSTPPSPTSAFPQPTSAITPPTPETKDEHAESSGVKTELHHEQSTRSSSAPIPPPKGPLAHNAPATNGTTPLPKRLNHTPRARAP